MSKREITDSSTGAAEAVSAWRASVTLDQPHGSSSRPLVIAAAATALPGAVALVTWALGPVTVAYAALTGVSTLSLAILSLVFVRDAWRHQAASDELEAKTRDLDEMIERAQAEMRMREESLRLIAHHGINWEIWFAGDGKPLWISPGVKRLTGFSAETCLTQPNHPLEVIHPDDRDSVARVIAIAAQNPKARQLECRVIGRDGAEHWCLFETEPVLDSKGKGAGFRASIRDVTEQKALQQRVDELTVADALTGVLSRDRFIAEGEAAVEEARRYDRALSVANFSVDQLRHINEQRGAAAGNECLSGMAQILGVQLRSGDVIGRLSGNEFAMLLADTPLGDALRFVERLRLAVESIELPMPDGGEGLRFTISAGVADLLPQDDSFDLLLAHGSSALGKAKRDGRNQVAFIAPDTAPAPPAPTASPQAGAPRPHALAATDV